MSNTIEAFITDDEGVDPDDDTDNVRSTLTATNGGEVSLAAIDNADIVAIAGALSPAGGGGAEGPRGEPLGLLGRARVVHGVVLEILRQVLAGVEALLELGVGDVAGHDHGAGERQAGLDRKLAELGSQLLHAHRIEVDLDNVSAQIARGDLRQVLGRIGLELFEEDAVARDLGLGLAVGRARDPDADRTRGPVPR